MKSLKLKALAFGSTEILSRAQLKNVLGGDGSGDDSGGCGSACSGTCTITSGVCAGYTGNCAQTSTGKCYCAVAC